MTARANKSSGPEAPRSQDGSHPVAYAVLSGIAVSLFLPVVGLLLASHDTYFSALLPASLAGGAIVAFFVWRRERQTSFFQPRGPFENGDKHTDASKLRPKDGWTPEPKHLVPFGPGGVGQWLDLNHRLSNNGRHPNQTFSLSITATLEPWALRGILQAPSFFLITS